MHASLCSRPRRCSACHSSDRRSSGLSPRGSEAPPFDGPWSRARYPRRPRPRPRPRPLSPPSFAEVDARVSTLIPPHSPRFLSRRPRPPRRPLQPVRRPAKILRIDVDTKISRRLAPLPHTSTHLHLVSARSPRSLRRGTLPLAVQQPIRQARSACGRVLCASTNAIRQRRLQTVSMSPPLPSPALRSAHARVCRAMASRQSAHHATRGSRILRTFSPHPNILRRRYLRVLSLRSPGP
ncbi:hypothetical protein DFH09DRAFT_444915 [Mycena vulgaris]|nr:hypothetical protein DFH09DRAFT_444915 [Mycena vulgaris]